MGVRGWIGVRLDRDVDWDALAELAQESHQLSRPQPKARRSRKTAGRA
jgi:predicted DNA-binding protein (MmcQ/YjbR family)